MPCTVYPVAVHLRYVAKSLGNRRPTFGDNLIVSMVEMFTQEKYRHIYSFGRCNKVVSIRLAENQSPSDSHTREERRLQL